MSNYFFLKRSMIFLVVILAVSVLVWLLEVNQLNDDSNANKAEDPNYILSGVTGYQFSNEGDLKYELLVKKMTQTAEIDTVLLEQPQLIVYSKTNSIPWRLTANQGEVFNEGEKINLWEQVHLTRQTDDQDAQLDALTEWLTIYPFNELAETDKKVTITTFYDRTTGDGMKVDLTQKEIKLLSNVKGIHMPR